MSQTLSADSIRSLLPARPATAFKGTFGKVLVVAGSITYPGAASLASASAARIGAGLVCLAVGRSALSGPGRIPEVVLRILPEAEWGYLGEAAAEELLASLDEWQALLVGPGIGRDETTRLFVERLLGLKNQRSGSGIGFAALTTPVPVHECELPPTVLDADALALLSQVGRWWERLPIGRVVLTPHPGEMRRLLGRDLRDDPVAEAGDAARSWRQVVVLKGSTTVIAAPDGEVRVHRGDNPALATAGTGDVLAGAIAGLLAQGLPPFAAAQAGVYLHACAGKAVLEEIGDAGVLASDLLPRLPVAIAGVKRKPG